MALVPLRLLLDHAAENGYGIPAFNVNNLEQVQSIMEAAYETDSPVADAKSKASSYAKLLGASLGKVISLQENSAPSYSFPMLGVAKAEDASTPVIDLGEEEVSISITVKWALN